eukprot:TRINITY_DN9960_c0_g1_i1.p2 TRINITY_DN9960_c0_g1~~TRINITY_DN9960_c0_g1_i1.p2  ORF type:complete len:186 (+),score=31.22 TRINITY_DN9960_c0_g1_i1:88-645(+)
MAWDMTFDHTWSQRIEKEERAYLTGEAEAKRKEKEERRRRRREMSGSASCSELSYSSSRLSCAGSQALMANSASASALGSEAGASQSTHRRRHRSQKAGGTAPGEIPEHLQAVVKFPVDVKDLLTVRVKEDDKGRIPRIRMHPEKVKAMWWPGIGTFTRFNPEFCFEEAPEWTPAHILKGPKPKR